MAKRTRPTTPEPKVTVASVSALEPGSHAERCALAPLFRIMAKVLPRIAEETGQPLYLSQEPA